MADLASALDDIWAGRPLVDRAAQTRRGSGSNGSPTRTPSVAIIGAGFGGIGLAITLKKRGIDSLTILEKGDRVGGVWRDNTYPGATCDVPSQLYSFSFEPNPDWSRRLLAAAGDPRLPRALRRSPWAEAQPAAGDGGEKGEARRGLGPLADRDCGGGDLRGRRAGLGLRTAQPPGAQPDRGRGTLRGPDLPHRALGPRGRSRRQAGGCDRYRGEHDPGRPRHRRPGRPAGRLPALGALRDPEEGPPLPALGEATLPLVPSGAVAAAVHASGSSSRSSSRRFNPVSQARSGSWVSACSSGTWTSRSPTRS